MKKFATFTFMLFFLVNTIVVSAWAKPCMQNIDTAPSIQKSMDNNISSDMPCHDENNNNSNKHCDGICLCLHVLLTPSLITSDIQALSFHNLSEKNLISSQYELTSRTILPLLFPPETNS